MSEITLTDEQSRALDAVIAWRRSGRGGFFALTGPAGSGKTVLTKHVVDRLGSGATLTAMTGKAALRLAECVPGSETSTLHAKLYYPPDPGRDLRFDRRRQPSSPFVLVDESSMISPQIYDDLRAWSSEGVGILLVGDTFQLPPIITDKLDKERWGEDFSVFAHVRGAALSTVMRSVGGVLRAATRVREEQRICRESDYEDGAGYEFVECESPMDRAVSDWLDDQDDHMLVTWRNETRMSTSRQIREELGYSGALPDPGEPVLIKKNGGGFLNGEVVKCGGWRVGPVIGENRRTGSRGIQTMWLAVPGRGELLASVQGGGEDADDERFFDGTVPWIEDWKAFHVDLSRRLLPSPTPVTWGYCLTAHAAQGSQARRVTVFLDGRDVRSPNFCKQTTLPDGSSTSFANRWLYTSQTRAKLRATVVIGN